jgi:hypothetical protein
MNMDLAAVHGIYGGNRLPAVCLLCVWGWFLPVVPATFHLHYSFCLGLLSGEVAEVTLFW